LDKLAVRGQLMRSYAGKPADQGSRPQILEGRQHPQHPAAVAMTAGARADAESHSGFPHANLKRMFPVGQVEHETRRPVAKLLQTHRKALLITVSSWD